MPVDGVRVRGIADTWGGARDGGRKHEGTDIFAERGLSRDGVVVVVRPDQYVAGVFPLEATAELAAFFDGWLTPQV